MLRTNTNNSSGNFLFVIIIVIVVLLLLACVYSSNVDSIKESLEEQKAKLLLRCERLRKLIAKKELLKNRIDKIVHGIFIAFALFILFFALILQYILSFVGITSRTVESLIAALTTYSILASWASIVVYKRLPNPNEIINQVVLEIEYWTYQTIGKGDLLASLIENRNELILLESKIQEIESELNKSQMTTPFF